MFGNKPSKPQNRIDCLIGDQETLSSILADADEEVQSLLHVLVH